jgi:hypothetical protein
LPKDSDGAIVKNLLAKILTPHALTRVRRQASLSLNYRVTQVDAGGAGGSVQGMSASTKWRVQVIRAVEPTRGDEEEQDDALLDGIDARAPRVPPSVLLSDLGQVTENISHEVTLSSCTCQLPDCSGTPCRHQLAVYQMLLAAGTADIGSLTASVTDQIAPIWLMNSHTEAKVNLPARAQAGAPERAPAHDRHVPPIASHRRARPPRAPAAARARRRSRSAPACSTSGCSASEAASSTALAPAARATSPLRRASSPPTRWGSSGPSLS